MKTEEVECLKEAVRIGRGGPQSNNMAEAFVKTFKRDYVYVNDLSSADAVRQQLRLWFEDYNENAPHNNLQIQAPRQYMGKITAI